MKNGLSDQESQMIAQCLSGSSRAWRSFIDQFSGVVYYSVKKVLTDHCGYCSKEELEDLHNDVFVSIMENRGKKLGLYRGKNGCSLTTWIRIISVRLAIDHLRKKKPMVSISERTYEQEAEKRAVDHDPVVFIEDDQKKKLLQKIIEDLPPRDRLFMKLFYFENVPPEEIARIFNSSVNAIYSRASYIKNKIKEKLKKI